MIKQIKELPADERKMLKSLFWRTMCLSSSYNYERMQGLGYVNAMIPVINHFYKDKEDRIAGYQRHFEIFNTTPTIAGFITGLSAAMEKEASQDPTFDKSAINAVKVSLMGPFAGIGDSIFQAALRIITLGIGISLSLQGNPIGILLHLLIYNSIASVSRYWGVHLSYGYGSSLLTRAVEGGFLGHLTRGAGIVGLMTVGAMTCNMVSMNIAWMPNIQGSELNVQEILNNIFPNLLPLGLTFLCFFLIKKEVKPIWIMLAMFIIGILGKMAGIF